MTSSAITCASYACLFTMAASAETTLSFSSATSLSAFTYVKETFSSAFFYSRIGCFSARETLNSAISLFASLSLESPLLNLDLF